MFKKLKTRRDGTAALDADRPSSQALHLLPCAAHIRVNSGAIWPPGRIAAAKSIDYGHKSLVGRPRS
jgi:hypothetical protein